MKASKGELRQGSVVSLLEAAFQGQASGVLRLEQGRELKKIFFHQGRNVLCLSNRTGEGLEEFVVAQGKLREDELAALRAAPAAPGKNFLGALLGWQGIPGVAQEALLRDHAMHRCCCGLCLAGSRGRTNSSPGCRQCPK